MAKEIKTIPLPLQEIISSNIPLHVLNDFLKKSDKATANSWEKAFAKNAEEENFFMDIITDVLCFGNKTILAYNIKDEDVATFNLDGLDHETTEVGIVEVLKKDNSHYILFKKVINERFSSFTFTCRRNAIETYVLTKSDLSDDAKTRYGDIDSEIIVKTTKLVTVFDSVVYDRKNNIVFFVIDNLKYSYDISAFEMHAQLKNQLQALCPEIKKLELIDFFSCVEAIYNKSSEGIVHRLGFECNTGAVRDERLKKSQLDLRDEKYHTSGKAAIGGVIRPYKLGVTWHPTKYNELGTEIDIELNGNRKNLQLNGGLYSFQLNSNVTFNELAFVLYRIILYVTFE